MTSRHLLLAAVGLMASVLTVPAAQTVVNFEQQRGWLVQGGEQRDGQFVREAAPSEPRGLSGKLTWGTNHARYLEVRLSDPMPLTAFQEQMRGTCAVSVQTAVPDQVARVNLRLRDAKGEVFQWKQSVSLTSDSWQDVRYSITPDAFTDSWETRGKETGVPKPPVMLNGFVVAFSADAAGRTGSIYLDDVTCTGVSRRVSVPESVASSGSMTLLDAVTVQPHTQLPIPVMEIGDQRPLSLKLRNRALEEAAFRIELSMENFSGKKRAFAADFVLKPEETRIWKPGFRPLRQGTWWLTYRLVEADGDGERLGRTSVAVLEPAQSSPDPARPFYFGLCVHTPRWGDKEQELDVLASRLIGTDVVRTSIGWGHIQPDAATWNWEKADRIIRLYGDAGIQLQYLLAYTPDWASTADPEKTPWSVWSRKAPRLDAWKRFVARMAERYSDRVHLWEVWNEPDLGFFKGTADEYLAMLATAYRELKAAAPDNVVLTGGFGMSDRNPEFIEKVLREGRKHYDVLAWHKHGPFSNFKREVDGPLARLRRTYAPDKPVYFNETAMAAAGGGKNMQRRQAEALVQKLVFGWSRGAIGYNWYQLRDRDYDVDLPTSAYGLLTRDYEPKPAYAAFNALTTVLRGHRYHGELEFGTGNLGFAFRDDSTWVVVAWSESGGGIQQRVLTTDADTAHVVDIMGNRSALPLLPGGNVLLDVGRTPSYVVLEGASRAPRPAGSFIELSRTPVLVPGTARPVRFQVRNPMPQARRFAFRFELPATLGADVLRKEARLAPREQRTIEFHVTVPQSVDSGQQPPAAELSYEVQGTDLSGRLHVPMHFAKQVSNAPGTKPDFVLDRIERVVNKFDADPTHKELQWQGPGDLSARISLFRGDGSLEVHIDVTDDVFVQPYQGKDTWKGDNVQMAFAVPGQDGYWGLNLAKLEGGGTDVYCTRRPSGFADPSENTRLRVARPSGDSLRYRVSLPYQTYGLSPEILAAGIRFSLIVNDNDGDVREGWIRLSKGIGTGKNPSFFPFLVFVEPSAK